MHRLKNEIDTDTEHSIYGDPKRYAHAPILICIQTDSWYLVSRSVG